MFYYTRLYNWSTHSDYIISMIKEFHIFGHGIELGMPETEHLERVLDWADNNSALLVFSGDVPVGMVLVCPELQKDPHYPGLSMHTMFTVVLPGHPGATLALYRGLVRVAKANNADWLCTTKRTSDYTYTKRGHPLWAGLKNYLAKRRT